MPETDLEKQLEKQMKLQKQQAEKALKETKRQAQEQERQARKEQNRKRAESMVKNQPFVDDFRILDTTAEEVLRCLLSQEIGNNNRVSFNDDIFPGYLEFGGVSLEIEKLVQYGMVTGVFFFDGGGWLNLLPPAFSYEKDKADAYERQKAKDQTCFGFFYNAGNIVFGDVSGSSLSVDNSFTQIEKMIDENAGEDAKELHDLLDEIKELIDNIETSRSIPKQKKLYQKITDHMAKHGWFYGAVIQLLGTASLGMIGG